MNRKMSRMMERDPAANMLTHRFPNMFTPLQQKKVLACTQTTASQRLDCDSNPRINSNTVCQQEYTRAVYLAGKLVS